MTEYRTLADEAQRLNVSVKTLRRRISEGKLRAYRVGTLIRVNPDETDAALLRPIPTVAEVA